MLYRTVTTSAAAAQISFYLETGGEIQWLAAGSLAKDSGGLRLMLSGLPAVLVSILAFCIVARLLTPSLYDAVDTLFGTISSAFLRIAKKSAPEYKLLIADDPDDDKAVESEEYVVVILNKLK